MKFTIRDLLWLTVVVALGVAWWVDRSQLTEKIDELAAYQTWGPKLRLSDVDPNVFNSLAPAPNPPKK